MTSASDRLVMGECPLGGSVISVTVIRRIAFRRFCLIRMIEKDYEKKNDVMDILFFSSFFTSPR